MIDIHTHLGGEGIRQAQTLADIVSYHWVHLELVRAGADISNLNITANPNEYLNTIIPFFPAIKNTSNHWCLMKMLKDLYGFKERTLNFDNW